MLIGAAYMKQMLEQYEGNIVLATASYNAGPGRVNSWRPKHAADCVEPDIWIERIPFNETRKYVRRVLYYSVIYDWRLDEQIGQRMSRQMAAVRAKGQPMPAGLSCSGGMDTADAGR